MGFFLAPLILHLFYGTLRDNNSGNYLPTIEASTVPDVPKAI